MPANLRGELATLVDSCQNAERGGASIAPRSPDRHLRDALPIRSNPRLRHPQHHQARTLDGRARIDLLAALQSGS
jgi:hypothetical protein